MPAAVRSLNRFQFKFTPPKLPILLKLAMGIPPLADEGFNETIAMKVTAFPDQIMRVGSFGTISLAQQLAVALPTLKIDDIPMMELELGELANSFQKNIWPRLSWMTNLKMQPLLALALAARLHLNLEKILGVDPMTLSAGEIPPRIRHRLNTQFHLPSVPKMRLIAGLAPAIDLANRFKIDLGDREAPAVFNNYMKGLSRISPPTFDIPFPLVLKLAAMLESLAVIQEAFGDDAMTNSGLRNIATRFRFYNHFNLPLPDIPLPLMANFDIPPPPLPDLATGLRAPAGFASGLAMLPLQVSVAPFMNMMVALALAMKLALDIEPMSPCMTCACMTG
jgi:hypothetical protein